MKIRKELQNFLNDNDILNLIANEDWKNLFSEAERLYDDVSTLHEILVKSNIASTN